MALLRIEKNNGIATVYLNRPDKRNAMSFALLKELVTTAKAIQKDRDIRCVILTGEAQVFSAGIDLSDLNNPKNSAFAIWELVKPGQSLFQKAFLIWQNLPVPVIAALEGYCFGAGMQLALAADIRIAHPDIKMSIMESRWGLVPDMGLTRSLKGLIGVDLAKELTLTARVFDGNYAKDIGLVTHLSENPLEKANAIASEMLQRSPDALTAAKRVLDAMEHQPEKSLRLEKSGNLNYYLVKIANLLVKKTNIRKLNFYHANIDKSFIMNFDRNTPIAFLGIGLMGSRMASRLIQAGFQVAVWNRTASACEELIDIGAHALDLSNIGQYPLILTCLADDKAVQAVFDQIQTNLKAGQVIVDFSSLSVAATKALAQAAASQDVIWIDSLFQEVQLGQNKAR